MEPLSLLGNEFHHNPESKSQVKVSQCWRMTKKVTRKNVPFLLICLTTVAVFVAVIGLWSTKEDSTGFCTTPMCFLMSTILTANMDHSADPCIDFYQYSCGGKEKFIVYSNMHQIPTIGSKTGGQDGDGHDAAVKFKQFWNSCIDISGRREQVGGTPLEQLIRKLGGWSLDPTGFDVTKFNFQRQLEILHHEIPIASSLFFSTIVALDLGNLTKNAVHLIPNFDFVHNMMDDKSVGLKKGNDDDQDQIQIPGDENETQDDDSVDEMMKVAILLGVLDDQENSTRIKLTKVIALADEIQNLQSNFSEYMQVDENISWVQFNLTKLNELCSIIDWKEYFKAALCHTGKSSLCDDEMIAALVVIVHHPLSYFTELCSFIEAKLSTDEGKIILNDLMIWQVVQSMTPYLSKEFHEDVETKNGNYSSTKLKNCVRSFFAPEPDFSIMQNAFMSLVATEQGHLLREKGVVQDMIENIQNEFKSHLINLTGKEHDHWLDDETISWIVNKVDAMEFIVGYSDFILNKSSINQFYNGLIISPNDFFTNVVAAAVFEHQKDWEKIDEPVQLTEYLNPMAVNGYHFLHLNQIFLPPALLRHIYFHIAYPASINYGFMGFFVGHEIFHGFIHSGERYDKNEQFGDWWSNETLQKYQHMSACLVEQYSDAVLNNMTGNVDGLKTLNENLADAGGLKFAYNAFTNHQKSHGDLRLPNVDLNSDQLFYLTFAQPWCSKNGTDWSERMKVDVAHSPNPVRVNEVLKNSPEFARAFNCALNSPMNPFKKCSVW